MDRGNDGYNCEFYTAQETMWEKDMIDEESYLYDYDSEDGGLTDEEYEAYEQAEKWTDF